MTVTSRAKAAAIAACVVLVVSLGLIDALPVGVFYDDAMYVVLAKSLATGHGYHWLHLPQTPAATHFPPGYPALLAATWKLFPSFPANVLAFKALNAVLLAGVAASLVVFQTRRFGFSPAMAAGVAVAGCLAVPMLVLSTQVMSETLFLALLLPALLLAERVADWDASVRTAIGLGVAVGALMLVRSHGVALLAAIVAAFVLRRRWRSLAITGATAAVVLAPWELWKFRNDGTLPVPMRGSYESYGNWLARGWQSDGLTVIARTMWQTAVELFTGIMTMSTAGLPQVVRWPLALLLLGVLALGWVRLWQKATVAALFVAAYVGVILVWPFAPTRFVWGVWPLVLLLGVLGTVGVLGSRPTAALQRTARAAALLGIAALLAGYSVYSVRGYRGAWWTSIPRQNALAIRPLIQWANRSAAPWAVIASNAEVPLFLYTGRSSVPATSFSVNDFFAPPTVAARAEALRSILGSYRVDAVAIVADAPLSIAARSLAAEQPPALVLRDSLSNGLIFFSTLR